MSPKLFSIYTDGACKGNPGPGGYAAIVVDESGARKEISGGRRRTTNNRMEMMALVEALKLIDEPARLEIATDSQYLLGGLQKGWVKGWKRKGWLTAAGEPVLNKDLWMALESLLFKHRVEYRWVKGHAGDKENNRCDELAVAASHRKDLPLDEAYGVQEAELRRRKSEASGKKRSAPPPRAEKSPAEWDDDLFSRATEKDGAVNWDF
jgi:ribonuclease HI